MGAYGKLIWDQRLAEGIKVLSDSLPVDRHDHFSEMFESSVTLPEY